MLIFQTVLLVTLALNSEDLYDFTQETTIIFWWFSIFSYCVYFYTAKSCPGFVSQKELSVSMTGKLQIEVNDEKSGSFEMEVHKSDLPKETNLKNDGVDGQPAIPKEHINTYRSEGGEEKDKGDIQADDRVEDIKIMEIRHCTICRIDQPLRTKHCRECGKCIATHDHHCPWLGICIGERNKKKFYFYLVIQLSHLIWGLIAVRLIQVLFSFHTYGSVGLWFFMNSIRILLVFVLSLFTFMVGCLMFFHFYLASINLTTWEYLSWSKISYLKTLEWSKGSPFSQGLLKNLFHNCCRRLPNYLISWEINILEENRL